LAKEGKEILKIQLQQKALQKKRNKKVTLKKVPPWLIPISIEKKYAKKIREILKSYIDVTVKKIKPLLSLWNQERKLSGIKDNSFRSAEYKNDRCLVIKKLFHIVNPDELKEFLKDQPVDDMEAVNREYEQLTNEYFGSDSNLIKNIIVPLAISLGIFNNKQWQKILNQSLSVELFLREPWQEQMIREWTARNVSLIKGMTDDYVKKINEKVFNAFQQNKTMSNLSKDLTKINQEFANGKTKIIEKEVDGKIIKTRVKTQSRSDLIARDQMEKLNSQYTQKRQTEAGVEWYFWSTMLDRRVRGNPGGLYPTPVSSHWALEGKVCSWNDSTIYADSIEDARNGNWKKRSSIGATQSHPGWDINCRCFGSAIFDDIVSEVNKEISA